MTIVTELLDIFKSFVIFFLNLSLEFDNFSIHDQKIFLGKMGSQNSNLKCNYFSILENLGEKTFFGAGTLLAK